MWWAQAYKFVEYNWFCIGVVSYLVLAVALVKICRAVNKLENLKLNKMYISLLVVMSILMATG